MHVAYNPVPHAAIMASIDDFIDAFVAQYKTHVVFLGRMWRVWRNGEWVVGNDAEVNTYIHKMLLELERSELPPSPTNGVYNRRQVLYAMRDLEYRDLMISLLKMEPGLQASDFEQDLRDGKGRFLRNGKPDKKGAWRAYQKWVAQLPTPPGETKRVGRDPDEVEAALLEEYRELGIFSYRLDPEQNWENVGMHVEDDRVPYVPFKSVRPGSLRME